MVTSRVLPRPCAAAELDQKPDLLHLYSQPRTAGFLASQQEFSAANP
jgi:hypothetical protein